MQNAGYERLTRLLASPLEPPYFGLTRVAELIEQRPDGYEDQVREILNGILAEKGLFGLPLEIQVKLELARAVIGGMPQVVYSRLLFAHSLAMGLRPSAKNSSLYVEAAIALALHVCSFAAGSPAAPQPKHYLEAAEAYLEPRAIQLGSLYGELRCRIQEARDYLRAADKLNSQD
jgi:hypothetical protein